MTCFSVYEAMFLFTNILMLQNDTSLHQYKNTNELFSVCVQPFNVLIQSYLNMIYYDKYSWLHSSIRFIHNAIKFRTLPSLPFFATLVSIPPTPDSSPWTPLVLTLSADATDAWSLFEEEWGPWWLPTGEWMAVERFLRRVLNRDTKDVLFLKL